MQTLPPEESRKILDAMGIPVVVLRDRPIDAVVSPAGTTVSESVSRKTASDLIRALDTSSQGTSSQVEEAITQVERSLPEDIAVDVSIGSPDQSVPLAETKPLRFTLVSAVSVDALLACELPEWAGGLLEGRLTGLCSDLLRAISSSAQDVDWQYFHWPIAGIKDHSREAAIDALDAWLHRRWAETSSTDPVIALAVSQIDLSSIFSDALVLPSLDELAVSSEAKRLAWGVIKERARG
jgi:hypothetical protein